MSAEEQTSKKTGKITRRTLRNAAANRAKGGRGE
jgi:hypothetical protein